MAFEIPIPRRVSRIRIRSLLVLSGAAILAGAPGCSDPNNLHLVDGDDRGKFAVYRSGQPDEADLGVWCQLGVREIYALNGWGAEYQAQLARICPEAKIVFNEELNADAGISKAFLDRFDASVTQARERGTKILFHCGCGCHRTGRLAAYYRMKYNGWSPDRAIEEMNDLGKDMGHHPTLPAQIRALEEYIQGRPCTQESGACVNHSG